MSESNLNSSIKSLNGQDDGNRGNIFLNTGMAHPRIRIQTDLDIAYGQVCKMARGTIFEKTPWKCVLYEGLDLSGQPIFNGDLKSYKFAVAIFEDVPIFTGMKLWDINTGKAFVLRASGSLSSADGEFRHSFKNLSPFRYPRDNLETRLWEIPAPIPSTIVNSDAAKCIGTFIFETVKDKKAAVSTLIKIFDIALKYCDIPGSFEINSERLPK